MAAFARADRGVDAVTRRCVVGSNVVSPCSRNCIPEPADATDTLCDEGSMTSNIGKNFLVADIAEVLYVLGDWNNIGL